MKNIQLLLTGFVISLSSASVHALTAPIPISEPSILQLAGVGAVAGILVWRSRRKR